MKGNYKKGGTMSQTLDRYGYPQTSICVNGKQRTVTVHRLVATAFHGLPPEGKPQINHINGIKTDNRPENLEWCNNAYNVRHALAIGLKTVILCGSSVTNSKLNEASVLEIRKRAAKRSGTPDNYRSMAREFNVSEAAISMAINRITWKHI